MCSHLGYRIPYSRVPPRDSTIHRGRNECGTDSQRDIVHAVIPDRLR